MSAGDKSTRAHRLTKILDKCFAPLEIKVTNVSSQHRGHAGDDGTGETHFDVVLTSASFANMSRIERHRAVMDVMEDEFSSGLHALSLDLRAP